MNPDKEIRSDAKLKNLPQEALDTLWRYRNPEEDGKKLSLLEVQIELLSEFDIHVSLSTLSEFYSWLRLRRRMDAAASRAMQARIELAKDGSLSPEDLERAAQIVFTAETLEAGDVKGYVALAKLSHSRQQLQHDARKLALLEAKAQQADKASAVMGDGKLTEEEKAAKLKQIFRMG